eukprot:Rmarinus@m.27290
MAALQIVGYGIAAWTFISLVLSAIAIEETWMTYEADEDTTFDIGLDNACVVINNPSYSGEFCMDVVDFGAHHLATAYDCLLCSVILSGIAAACVGGAAYYSEGQPRIGAFYTSVAGVLQVVAWITSSVAMYKVCYFADTIEISSFEWPAYLFCASFLLLTGAVVCVYKYYQELNAIEDPQSILTIDTSPLPAYSQPTCTALLVSKISQIVAFFFTLGALFAPWWSIEYGGSETVPATDEESGAGEGWMSLFMWCVEDEDCEYVDDIMLPFEFASAKNGALCSFFMGCLAMYCVILISTSREHVRYRFTFSDGPLTINVWYSAFISFEIIAFATAALALADGSAATDSFSDQDIDVDITLSGGYYVFIAVFLAQLVSCLSAMASGYFVYQSLSDGAVDQSPMTTMPPS